MAQIGPESFAVGGGDGGGTPMAQASINPGMTRSGMQPGGANPVALAPGGEFEKASRADEEAIDSIIKMGKAVMEPIVERKKKENFWIGVQAASQGNAVKEMVGKQNAFSKLLGPSEMIQGARMFTVDSELQKTYSDITDNMDELKKMGPTEFAKHVIDKAQSHMTHDSDTNAMIQGSMMKMMPQVLGQQAKAHYEFAQSEYLRTGFNQGMAAADTFQSQSKYASTALANGTMSVDDYKASQATALSGILAPLPGESSEVHATRVKAVMVGQINKGGLSLYHAALREGMIGQLSPEVQLQLANAAQGGGLNQAKQNFAAENPKLISDFTAAFAATDDPDKQLAIANTLNEKFNAYTGNFGSTDSFVDTGKTVANSTLALVNSRSKLIDAENKYNASRSLYSRIAEYQVRAKTPPGEPGAFASLQENIDARLALVDEAHRTGVTELFGLENPMTPVNDYMSDNAKAKESEMKLMGEQAKFDRDKLDISTGVVSVLSGNGLENDGDLNPAQKEAVFQTVSQKVGIAKAMDLLTVNSTGAVWVSERTKNQISNFTNSKQFNAELYAKVKPLYDELKKFPNGSVAIEKYFGADAQKMEMFDQLQRSDRSPEQNIGENFNKAFGTLAGLSAAQARAPTKSDREIVESTISNYQPARVFGNGDQSVGIARVDGGHLFTDQNATILNSVLTESFAIQKVHNPNMSPEQQMELALKFVRTKGDLINGIFIPRPDDAPTLASIVNSDNELRFNERVATEAFQKVVAKQVGGDPDDVGNLTVSRIRNGRTGGYDFIASYATKRPGFLGETTESTIGDTVVFSYETYREAYKEAIKAPRIISSQLNENSSVHDKYIRGRL